MPDSLFFLLKMTFNLKESVDKIVYKNTFVVHPFTPETENIEFNEVTKNMISSQPLTA
jgi:hypothetical protein